MCCALCGSGAYCMGMCLMTEFNMWWVSAGILLYVLWPVIELCCYILLVCIFVHFVCALSSCKFHSPWILYYCCLLYRSALLFIAGSKMEPGTLVNGWKTRNMVKGHLYIQMALNMKVLPFRYLYQGGMLCMAFVCLYVCMYAWLLTTSRKIRHS